MKQTQSSLSLARKIVQLVYLVVKTVAAIIHLVSEASNYQCRTTTSSALN
jgi:hypothetical protein